MILESPPTSSLQIFFHLPIVHDESILTKKKKKKISLIQIQTNNMIDKSNSEWIGRNQGFSGGRDEWVVSYRPDNKKTPYLSSDQVGVTETEKNERNLPEPKIQLHIKELDAGVDLEHWRSRFEEQIIIYAPEIYQLYSSPVKPRTNFEDLITDGYLLEDKKDGVVHDVYYKPGYSSIDPESNETLIHDGRKIKYDSKGRVVSQIDIDDRDSTIRWNGHPNLDTKSTYIYNDQGYMTESDNFGYPFLNTDFDGRRINKYEYTDSGLLKTWSITLFDGYGNPSVKFTCEFVLESV